jgi:hypothetical protein
MRKFFACIILTGVLLTTGCAPVMPPPPPPAVVMPARPYADAVWVTGHYKWRPWAHRYQWVPGHWKVRRGRAWVIIN